MTYKTIAKTVPGFMSLAVAGEAIKMVPKNFKKPVKKPVKKIIKGAVTTLTGVALIKPVANITAGL